MSRRMNTGFKLLLAAKAAEWKEPVALADIACAIGCSRQNLGAYINGRRALPYIEAKLATFFNLSIPALRRTLFNNNNQEKHHDREHTTTGPQDQPRNARRTPRRPQPVREGRHQ